MEEHIIPDDDRKGVTLAFIGTDVEFVNPIEYYKDWHMRKTISLEKHILHKADAVKASLLSDDFFINRARAQWDERFKEIMQTEVPPNFISLLTSQSKKEQERLLRGQSLSPYQLSAYLFRAWSEFGFSFSNYTGEHHHKGVDESTLPSLIVVGDDQKVRTAGETTLTEGQLKNVVNYRKVTVAKFLDKGENWHCFFTVYKALRGEESWKDGLPHFHYISDKWGIAREEAVKQLKSEKYPSTNIHIDLLGYDDKSRVK